VLDFAVIGGGIVGLATAHELGRSHPAATILVLEKEKTLASHQTGHNSGVIHSGIYYRPGSLKARNCRAGVVKLVRFCEEHDIRYEMCGKVIVAVDEDERARLHGLLERGRSNGVPGLRLVDRDELRSIEPSAEGVAALVSPETGIVAFKEVALALARLVRERGGSIRTGVQVHAIDGTRVETSAGVFEARRIVSCTGLHADRLMSASAGPPPLLVVGFRGEYYRLKTTSRHLVRHLIYPVPDPRFPFLGVHFTRRINGEIEAGPNAVLAWAREGYRRSDFEWRDVKEMMAYPGFWRMGRRHWRTALGEQYRSLSKSAFVRGLQRLVPAISSDDLEQGGAGVRAMALGLDGSLIDDYRIERAGSTVHVLSAPSPAATSALAIGEHVAAVCASDA